MVDMSELFVIFVNLRWLLRNSHLVLYSTTTPNSHGPARVPFGDKPMNRNLGIAALAAILMTTLSACGVGEAKVADIADQAAAAPLPVEVSMPETAMPKLPTR